MEPLPAKAIINTGADVAAKAAPSEFDEASSPKKGSKWPSAGGGMRIVMNTKAELIRKLKTLSLRIYYEKNGAVYSAVFSGKSELEILLKLQSKGIRTRDIRGVEEGPVNDCPAAAGPRTASLSGL